ncbi:hypothetical protein AWZ03_015132, partial [Drosophila navojoa]
MAGSARQGAQQTLLLAPSIGKTLAMQICAPQLLDEAYSVLYSTRLCPRGDETSSIWRMRLFLEMSSRISLVTGMLSAADLRGAVPEAILAAAWTEKLYKSMASSISFPELIDSRC